MADTTLPVSHDVREQLEQAKEPEETWNGFLLRLLESAETDGQMWTEGELRSISRQEAKDMIRQFS